MNQPAAKKGNPELSAALRVLKRLQEKHQGVVKASDLSGEQWSPKDKPSPPR